MPAAPTRSIRSLLPGLAVTTLVALCLVVPSSAAARFMPTVCNATGATWHLAEYFPTNERKPNGDVVYLPAKGNHYTYYGTNQAFCHKMNRWIPKLTGAANKEGGFENTITGRIHIPKGYDLIEKGLSPPGYNCIATIDDPRRGHHHDNPHQGSCFGQTGKEHSLAPFTWTAVLPPETSQ